MLIEIDEEQLRKLQSAALAPLPFFLHTPLCGTCKAARKMCVVALETVPGAVMYACNLNQMPQVARDWQIQSVPCLAVVHRGKVVERMYAFGSAIKVYEKLKSLHP